MGVVMRKSELIELIHSLHHRCSIDGDTIMSICLDILGYDTASDEAGKEMNALVNEAFRGCDKEVLEYFEEQDMVGEPTAIIEASKPTTTDNVVRDYFK